MVADPGPRLHAGGQSSRRRAPARPRRPLSGSAPALNARPPQRLIGALLLATLVLPVAAAFGITEVGGFRMFTRFLEYRVLLFTQTDGGPPRRLPAERLMPHLGRDARRVVGYAYDFI